MTYYPKERRLQIGVYEKVKLTKKENRLLICLSSGNITSQDEIRRYLGFETKEGINGLVSRLRKRSKNNLHIENKRGIGYILKDELYFG